MTTYYSLTSVTALADLRLDLADPSGTARWSDATLNRCIDRANEAYSWAYPLFESQQIPTIKGCNLYASPTSSWYVDKIEYPVGRYPKNFPGFFERKTALIPTPTTVPPNNAAPLSVADGGAGGLLSAGAYQWAFTYLVPGGGETPTSPVVSTTLLASHKASLSIPTGPYGVQNRNLYRTVAGGAQLKLVAALGDNFTTTYLDNTADASLGTNAPSSNTTQGIDMFEMQIPPDLYPSDATTYTIEVWYALKHILDVTLGTTIPERHWDALFYGAVAFAMEAYLPTVNDNFEYNDGHLRDRVDDTKSTIAWQTQCKMAKNDFDRRLKTIKEESNAGSTMRIRWGDSPLRWERT
jgi:hypothetical protein